MPTFFFPVLWAGGAVGWRSRGLAGRRLVFDPRDALIAIVESCCVHTSPGIVPGSVCLLVAERTFGRAVL
jgi:hypothetical protein